MVQSARLDRQGSEGSRRKLYDLKVRRLAFVEFDFRDAEALNIRIPHRSGHGAHWLRPDKLMQFLTRHGV